MAGKELCVDIASECFALDGDNRLPVPCGYEAKIGEEWADDLNCRRFSLNPDIYWTFSEELLSIMAQRIAKHDIKNHFDEDLVYQVRAWDGPRSKFEGAHISYTRKPLEFEIQCLSRNLRKYQKAREMFSSGRVIDFACEFFNSDLARTMYHELPSQLQLKYLVTLARTSEKLSRRFLKIL